MKVGTLLKVVAELKKKGSITNNTEIVMASDLEGNSYNKLHTLFVERPSDMLLAYPDEVEVEFQGDEEVADND